MVLTSEFARNCAASLKSVPAALRRGRCAARDPRRFWRPRRRALTLTPAIRPGRAQWLLSGLRASSVAMLPGAAMGRRSMAQTTPAGACRRAPAPDRQNYSRPRLEATQQAPHGTADAVQKPPGAPLRVPRVSSKPGTDRNASHPAHFHLLQTGVRYFRGCPTRPIMRSAAAGAGGPPAVR